MKAFLDRIFTRWANRMMTNYDRSSRFTKGMIAMMLHVWPGQITCKQFNEFLVDFVDDDLPPQIMQTVQYHLKICPTCRRHHHDYVETIKLSKAAGGGDEIVKAPQDLVNAILIARQAIDDGKS